MPNTETDVFKGQKNISKADLSALQNIASSYRAIASDIRELCVADLVTPGEHTRSFALEANYILEQAHKLDDIISNIVYDYGNSAM